MNIYLTRHGETEWNKVGKLQGQKDSILTDNGILNARQLGVRLESVDLDCIYSSPLKRAYNTACYIRGDKKIPLKVKDHLKEMNFGHWEGMQHELIKIDYGEDYTLFWNQPHLYKPSSGEGFQDLIKRVKVVLDHIISEANSEKSDNILIVTHTAVIKAVYAIIENRTLDTFWDPPFIYDTSLTIIEVSEENMRIKLKADISHVDKQ